MIVKRCKHVYTFKMTFLRISHQVRYIFEENGGLVSYQESEKLLEWEAVLEGGEAPRASWECVGMTPSREAHSPWTRPEGPSAECGGSELEGQPLAHTSS